MKDPKEFSVDEVCLFLVSIELGHMHDKFRENGVDGPLLVTLSDADYKELGLSGLQTKKVMRSLAAFSSSASSTSDEQLAQLQKENQELKNEVRDLRAALQPEPPQQPKQQPPPPPQQQAPPPPQQQKQQPQSGIERRHERREDRREDRHEHGIIGGGMERRMDRREDRRERRRF